LLEDAAHSGQRQVLLRMRDRYLAGLRRVLELVVRAHGMNQEPAIGLDLLDERRAVHSAKYTHNYTMMRVEGPEVDRSIARGAKARWNRRSK